MPQTRRNLKIPALVATLILLIAVAVEGRFRPRPAEAEPYHEHVRQAVLAMPQDMGDWHGRDEQVPKAAQQLLKPNAIYSRTFRNDVTGDDVGVLVVHCKDARDLLGHYPPRCYPAHGMPERESLREAGEIELDGHKTPYTIYQFAGRNVGSRLTVYNFIILPGEVCPDMTVVDERAGDYTRRFYGAAQLQVVFRGDRLDAHNQDEIFRQMLQHHLPIIQAIRAGEGL